VIRADGGALTSDAGVLLLRQLDERLGLTRGLAGCLVDRREQGKVRHDVLALLRQRIYQIALGYEDCNDADHLRADPALKLAVGRAPTEDDLASQPTLSRLENQVGWHECWRISGALLRPGNVHGGHRAMALIKAIITRLRQAFPECVIELRADSALARPEIYEGCEQLAIPYTVSLPKNERLIAMAQPWRRDAEAIHAQIGEQVQVFGEFAYAADTWLHERRVIAKAQVMGKGENPRFVVTSRTDLEPEAHYRFYCQRGDPENRIKELKLDLKADRLSCHRFWANQFRLLLHAAAYMLMQAMRAALAGTEFARAQVSTLRLRLLKVGARIRESVRRVWVQLPSAYPWAHLWPRLARAGPG